MVKPPLCSVIQPGTSMYASVSTIDRFLYIIGNTRVIQRGLAEHDEG